MLVVSCVASREEGGDREREDGREIDNVLSWRRLMLHVLG